MQAALAVPTAALARPRPALPARRAVRARANGPLREFREDTGEVSASQPESGSAASGSGAAQEKQQGQPKYIYADEQPVSGGRTPVAGTSVSSTAHAIVHTAASPSPACRNAPRPCRFHRPCTCRCSFMAPFMCLQCVPYHA